MDDDKKETITAADADDTASTEAVKDVPTDEVVSATDWTKPSENPDVQLTDMAEGNGQLSREGTPPPLPPRPRVLKLRSSVGTPIDVHKASLASPRPPLQSKATTALSKADIHASASPRDRPESRQASYTNLGFRRRYNGDADSVSVMSSKSYAPTLQAGGDVESMVGNVLVGSDNPAWKLLAPGVNGAHTFTESLFPEDPGFARAFKREFDEVEPTAEDGSNEGQQISPSTRASADNDIYVELVMNQFKSKLKHFLILSSAGKPVWSRHGDDRQITNYVGIVSTIIAFYQDAKDGLKGFTAGDVRFVILSKGPLNLVAISKLGESDAQLRVQLESLYMQILSTLTLPNMERMFKARASTDLRRPLQGTESLLSALADGFTRGSPSTLLSALECLRIRKTHRTTINNTLLKVKCPNLLYGLIVAGGRLVSVVRPKKHSLHPGDLHLIFNMLFEAGSVKAGGGENWIPLCLPGFNNTGYLYMYVSFLKVNDVEKEVTERPATSAGDEDEVAILLISTNKEGFFELRKMRDELVEVCSPLESNESHY